MTYRLAVLIGLVVAAALIQPRLRPADVAAGVPLTELPLEIGDWRGYPATDFDAETLAALGVDDHLHRTYVSRGQDQANVYIGYYRSQVQGASIHSPLNCLPGSGWELIGTERVPFAWGWARRAIIRKGNDYRAVMYWYQTATRIEGDEYRGLLYTVIDSIEYGRNDAALVRVIVPIDGAAVDAIPAARRAAEVAGLLEPQLRRLLFADAPGRSS